MNYIQFLKDLSIETARLLVNMPNESSGIEIIPHQLKSKLIFPNYELKDKKPRISEQEARFAFCQAFEKANHGLFYSVETPTKHNYSFQLSVKHKIEDLKVYMKNNNNLKNGQSAQSDMSIFSLEDQKFNQIINVEFKAKNVDIEHIAKDFLKLLAEPQHGLFFHLIKRINRGTLKSLFCKYKTSFKNALRKTIKLKYDKNCSYIFAVFIIEPKPILAFLEIQEICSYYNEIFEIDFDSLTNQKNDKNNNWSVIYL